MKNLVSSSRDYRYSEKLVTSSGNYGELKNIVNLQIFSGTAGSRLPGWEGRETDGVVKEQKREEGGREGPRGW